jgi:hypothetical protein
MTRLALVACLSVVVLGPHALAQGFVLVVDDDPGPGVAFTDLQSAVDAAMEGDVLLVKEGTYGGMVIDGKALVVQAEEDEIVTLLDSIVVRNLAPSQPVMLRELIVKQSAVVPQNSMLVENNLGPVWLEEIQVNPDDSVSPFHRFGAVVDNCVSVTMTRCDLRAGVSVAVFSRNSKLSFYDSTALGGNAGGGSAAVHVEDGSFFTSGSTLTGADGAPSAPPLNDGGNAIDVQGTAPTVRYLDCALVPGVGVLSSTATLGADGLAIDDASSAGFLEEIVGTSRSIQKNSPVREGNVVTETHNGVAFDLIFLIFSFKHTQLAYIPTFHGTACIGTPLYVKNRGLLDANGFKAKPVTLQLFDDGVESIVFYNQVAHFDLLTLEYWISSPTCSVHVPLTL